MLESTRSGIPSVTLSSIPFPVSLNSIHEDEHAGIELLEPIVGNAVYYLGTLLTDGGLFSIRRGKQVCEVEFLSLCVSQNLTPFCCFSLLRTCFSLLSYLFLFVSVCQYFTISVYLALSWSLSLSLSLSFSICPSASVPPSLFLSACLVFRFLCFFQCLFVSVSVCLCLSFCPSVSLSLSLSLSLSFSLSLSLSLCLSLFIFQDEIYFIFIYFGLSVSVAISVSFSLSLLSFSFSSVHKYRPANHYAFGMIYYCNVQIMHTMTHLLLV